jgi:hypothetical protein
LSSPVPSRQMGRVENNRKASTKSPSAGGRWSLTNTRHGIGWRRRRSRADRRRRHAADVSRSCFAAVGWAGPQAEMTFHREMAQPLKKSKVTRRKTPLTSSERCRRC